MKLTREERLARRHNRVRAKISGTPERPRLMIRRTLKNLYAQVYDDSVVGGSRTLVAVTTATKDNKGKHSANIPSAKALGAQAGEVLKQKGISSIVFDRGGYRYHGVVKAFAEAVREAGINF